MLNKPSFEQTRGSIGIIGVLWVFRYLSDGNPVGSLEERGEDILPAEQTDPPSVYLLLDPLKLHEISIRPAMSMMSIAAKEFLLCMFPPTFSCIQR